MNPLEKLLGVNWRTSLTAALAAITSALTIVAALPAQLGELSTIIPEEWKPLVIKAGIAATVLLKLINGFVAKDAKVVGNGTATEPNRVPDGEGGNKTLSLALLAGFAACTLAACATDTGDPAKDRRGRVTNAVLQEVGTAAFRIALDSLTQDADSRHVAGEKTNFAHSAAAGLWKESANIVNSGSLVRVVNAWGGHELPTVAAGLAREYARVAPQTPAERAAVIDRMASGLSTAAVFTTPEL